MSGPTPAAADVIISEVCDPLNNYTNDRFFELYNTGAYPVNLAGWTASVIANGNYTYITYNLSGTIQPGEALTAGNASCTYTVHDFTSGSSWANWNGGDTDGVRLMNSAGDTVDMILGDTFTDQNLVRRTHVGNGRTAYAAGDWTLGAVTNIYTPPATPGIHSCLYPYAILAMTDVETGPLRHGTGDSNTLYAGQLDTGPRLLGVVINQAGGTADDGDIPYLALWRDVNADSQCNAGDVPVGAIPWDAVRQAYRMTGSTWDQTAFVPWNFVITAGLADTAALTDGDTFRIEIRSDSGFLIDHDPGTTADDTWTPYLSDTRTNSCYKTINTRVSAAELNVVNQPAGYIRYNSSNNLIMAITIPDDGGCTTTFNDIRVTHAGTMTPGTDYSLSLWEDSNDNGVFDPTDADAAGVHPLTWNGGSSRWEDNGANLGLAIPVGGQRFFLAVTPTATAAHNATLTLTLPDPCFTLDPNINDLDAAVSSSQFTYQSRVASFRVSAPCDTPVNGAFTLTITALDLGGAVYTGFAEAVDLSVDSGTITPTLSDKFTNGVLNQVFIIDTVGDSNAIAVSHHPDTAVIISEVNSCTDGNASYVELFNQTAVTQDINNYKLFFYSNGAGAPTATENLAGTLGPGAYIVIARKPGNFTATYGLNSDYDHSSFLLDGGTDAVGLSDGAKVVDRFNNGPPATVAWTDNHLFERVALPNNGDSVAAHWDDLGLDRLGTPLAANANVIPLAASVTGTTAISITPQSGFGAALMTQPAAAGGYAGDTQQAIGVTMTGSSIYPVMDTIAFTIPASITWNGSSSDVTCSGFGFDGGQVISITGTGGTSDSYTVTIYGSRITSTDTGLITFHRIDYDGGIGRGVANRTQPLSIKTAQDSYAPAAIASLPSLAVLVPMSAVKISELCHSYTGVATDEFIELYNTLSCTVSLAGWRLRYGTAATNLRSAAGKLFTTFGAADLIRGRGYYLLANADYAGVVAPDFTWGGGGTDLAASGGQVAIDTGANAGIVDLFGWGNALYPEGEAFADNPADQEAATMERKANAFSTAASMATGADRYAGNGFDSDNNNNDFVKRTAGRDQQNTDSAPEPSFDGYGSISPANPIAKSGHGEWTITYRAGTDSFSNGQVDFIIPTTWTPPQKTVPTNPGFINVSVSNGVIGAVSVAGWTITVPVTSLTATTGEITVDYGYTNGGTNWGALAVARPTAGTDMFVVQTDQDGSDIASLLTPGPQLTTAAVSTVTFRPATDPRSFVGATYLLTATSMSGSDSVYGTAVNFAITGDGSDSYVSEASGYPYAAGSTSTSITGYTNADGLVAINVKVGSYYTYKHTVTVNDQSTPTGPYQHYNTTRLGFPVISEVGWSGFVNEYVEIYNPTPDTMSFTDSSFHFGDKNGVNAIASNAALAGKILGPHRYFLIEDAELTSPGLADYTNAAIDFVDADPGDSPTAYYDSRTVNEIVDALYTGLWFKGGLIGGYQVAMERLWIDRSAVLASYWADGDSVFPMNGETGKGSPGLPNQCALYASSVTAATNVSTADSVAITVTLRLNSDDLQPGHPVAVTNANPQHGCLQPAALTDDEGMAIGYAQSNSSDGTSTITVTYPSGVTETATVVFDYTPATFTAETHNDLRDTSGETALTCAVRVSDTISGLAPLYPKLRTAWGVSGTYGLWLEMGFVAGDTYALEIAGLWDEHSGETLYWQVLLKDNAGNEDTRTYSEYIDTSPALGVTIAFPEDNHDTIADVITVSGATAGTAAGDTVYLFVNSNPTAETGIVLASANGSWSGTVTLIGYDSQVLITAQILDQYGRLRYDSITVHYIANLAPPIIIMVPVDGETYAGSVTVTYGVYDPDNNSCTVTVEFSSDNGLTWQAATISSGSVNGVAADADGETYAIIWESGTDLPDTTTATILMRMYAYDGRDLGAADTTGFFGIDQQPPAAPTGLTALADLVADPDTGVWLAWESVGGDTAGYYVYVDTDANGFVQRLTATPITDTTGYLMDGSLLTISGTYAFSVTCVDAAGNESLHSETAAVMIDFTPPALFGLICPDLSDTSGAIPLTVTISAEDTLTGLAAGYPMIRFVWADSGIYGDWYPMTPAGGLTYTYDTFANWNEHGGETVLVQITARDEAGNDDTYDYPEVIELTPLPGIAITSPANDDETSVQVIIVTGTTTGTAAGDTVSLSINGYDTVESLIVLADANGGWSGTVTLLGSDSIIARLVDRYGRAAEETITVTWAPNATPLLAILVPVGGDTYSHDLTCSFVISDSTADACTVALEYSLDAGATWQSPTLVGGMAGLASSPTGETHTVLWQTAADYGGMSCTVLLRASVADAAGTGTGDTTGLFGLDNFALPAPTGLWASGDTEPPDTGVYLTWTGVAGDLAGYYVYGDTDGDGNWERVAGLLTDTTACWWSILNPGETCVFAVSSLDSYGNESARSDTAAAPIFIFDKYVGSCTLGESQSLAVPGATVEWRLRALNAGYGPGLGVIITDTVATNSVYRTDSAETIAGYGYDAVITYSHDSGATWDGVQTAPVTHIRWAIIGKMAANSIIVMSYEAIVE